MKQNYSKEENGLISNSTFTENVVSATGNNLIDESFAREIVSSCSHVQPQELQQLPTHIKVLQKNVIDCMDFSKCKTCCDLCEKESFDDLYLCLDCVYMGSLKENHWSHHVMTSGHFLCMNLKDSKVSCVYCLNEASSIGESYHQTTNTGLDCVEDCSFTQKNLFEELFNQYFHEHSFDRATSSGKGIEPTNPNTFYPFVTIDKPPTGIINIGNSCFLNCVLQILLATPPLTHFFLSGFHNCTHSKESCITCLLTIIFHYVITNESDLKLNVESLMRALCTTDKNSTLAIAQQDAHEYFILIIEKLRNEIYGFNCPMSLLNSDCLYSSCVIRSKNSNLSNTTSNLSYSNQPSYFDTSDNISHIFQGSYSHKVFCMACKNITSKFEPFIDISLGLQVDDNRKTTSNKCDTSGNSLLKKINSINLYDCIETFVKEETMCNGSTTYCHNCDSQQQKVTKFTLNKLPTILCLHMKRFTLGDGVKKLDTKIEFPLHLDLKDFIDATTKHFYNDDNDIKACDDIEKNGGTQYTLYGVVVHKGAYHSGHYLSYVRINQQWYLCDDEDILPVSFETVSQCEW